MFDACPLPPLDVGVVVPPANELVEPGLADVGRVLKQIAPISEGVNKRMKEKEERTHVKDWDADRVDDGVPEGQETNKEVEVGKVETIPDPLGVAVWMTAEVETTGDFGRASLALTVGSTHQ